VSRARTQRGTTFVELMAAATILMILAGAVLPLARVTVKRQRELELRRDLRELRTAIDAYKIKVDQGQIGGTDVKLGSEGYPPSLEVLVKGVSQVGKLDIKLKFLRHIPVDPLTQSAEWGLRCYQDDADSTHWCGDNVYDVYSKAEGKALDGTKYKDW
jgi:general secretion pathway protein G